MSRLEETTIIPATKGMWWGYQPVPPFKVQRWHVLGYESLRHWSIHDTLEAAMEAVAMQYLPVEAGFCIEVVDESFAGIFGLSKLCELAEAFAMAWGVGATFEVAERQGLIEPVNLAVWEMTARRSAPGG